MQYSVAVRSLCAFTAKTGDLDLRFTPAPTAQEGIAGHQHVAARRGSGYETEISLHGEVQQLTVRGRADGYDASRNRLEEIKTHRGELERQPANHRALHWAQAKVYGWLLCRERGLTALELALVYFDLRSGQETVFVETHSAQALQCFFEERCAAFLAWAKQELAHRGARDTLLSGLPFPHPSFRSGQRELAEAVYKGAATSRCVLAQAPTGIGKTVATLFAMLRAVPRYALHKVFYLTAKSTGRQLALEAAALLVRGQEGARLRVVELTAREKACEHRDKSCHGDSCPLARGFYDRLPAARAAALAGAFLDAASVRRIAMAHQVCPYYLAQELVHWADLVVGDYNYYFDGSALLHALTVANEWSVGVLADEAHNLVERARAMYSASLAQAALRALSASAPPPVRAAFERVNRHWNAARRANASAPLATVPAALLAALQHAAEALEAHFVERAPDAAGNGAGLQQFYFDVLAFLRRAESFGSHSVLELGEEVVARGRPAGTLRIQNLVPAPFLRPHLAAARTVTLFSATLNPPRYAMDLLGLPANTVWIDVESPFAPEQLQVQVVNTISTRYPHRQRSAEPIARLIARQYQSAPGNYLAFFSSFEYLALVASEFRGRHPEIPAWEQERGMDEGRRTAFLERFVPGGAGIGFAVLGGSFGEGVDLRGDRLVGAFVATLGLPQVNSRNEQLRACLDTLFGTGYDYAYLVPGLQKVVQAAGRVIRTQEDRGIVVLIDDRFSRPAVRELLPSWWRVTSAPPQRTPAP